MVSRRSFLAGLAGGPLLAQSGVFPMKFGIDLFSLRSQGWSPFELLDYCAKQGAKVAQLASRPPSASGSATLRASVRYGRI